jgi:thioredoxin 1
MKTNTNAFDKDVMQSAMPVLVDFYATWCGPCKMLGPVLEALAQQYQGRATIVKVDIDESPELAERFGITAVPTLMVFKGGQRVQQTQGYQSQRNLAAMLDAVLKPVTA